MQATKTRAAARSGILYLRTDELQPNPVQPRTVFDEDSLAELAESIRSYGILHPLTVRRRAALGKIIEKDMTVAAAESYIDALLAQKETGEESAEGKRSFVMRDLRLFLNSVTRSLELMRQGGVAADMQRRETPDALILTISIPKGKGL